MTKKEYTKSSEFQDKLASFLIVALVAEINETDSADKDRLAKLILAIQLVSTNLRFSSRYAYKEKKMI